MLAQTLGLEEALLIQLLQDAQQFQEAQWLQFSDAQRQQFLPFWSERQFAAVLRRLEAQGVIEVRGEKPWQILCQLPDLGSMAAPTPVVKATPVVETPIEKPAPAPAQAPVAEPPVEPQAAEPVPVFSMNEARMRNQYQDDLSYLKPEPAVQKGIRARKTKMHHDWEPSADFPQLLSFHDISLQFALSELAKFRQYYAAKDRTEISWDVPYLNWVQRAWRNSLNSQGRHDQQNANGEPADTSRTKRTQVRDALRNIQDTDW